MRSRTPQSRSRVLTQPAPATPWDCERRGPAALHYLFSISTGSASGGCTFTFTSAIRAVFQTRGKIAPGSALRAPSTGGGARRAGEGPFSSGRAGPSSSGRLGASEVCLLRSAQRCRHRLFFCYSQISVPVRLKARTPVC